MPSEDVNAFLFCPVSTRTQLQLLPTARIRCLSFNTLYGLGHLLIIPSVSCGISQSSVHKIVPHYDPPNSTALRRSLEPGSSGGGVSAIAFNIPSLGESGYHVQEVNSGYFYTTANGGIEATATRAGFHADGDGYGNSFSYYVVKDVNNFNTGISITPLITRPPDGGYCDAARCEDVSCAFAFSKQPTSPANLPRPRVGVVPTPPLYLCPFSRVEVAYDITFCPSYNWPHESAPVRIHPESFPDKCLRVRDAIYANGTPVDIVNCESGRVSQQWYINRGSTQIRAAGADKAFCLDAGSGPASGVPMKIWQCYDNLAAQKWYRYPIGVVDHDRIALVGKEQCLDLTNGQVWNGNRVQTWQCSQGNPNQAWSVTDA